MAVTLLQARVVYVFCSSLTLNLSRGCLRADRRMVPIEVTIRLKLTGDRLMVVNAR